MLEKRKFNTYKIKTSNPTYYCTSESWKKVYHACKDRKNKSSLFLKGNGALNEHEYILLYV